MKQLLVFTVLVVTCSLASGCKPSVVSADSAAAAVAGDSPAVVIAPTVSNASLDQYKVDALDSVHVLANDVANTDITEPVAQAIGL